MPILSKCRRMFCVPGLSMMGIPPMMRSWLMLMDVPPFGTLERFSTRRGMDFFARGPDFGALPVGDVLLK